MSKLNPKIVQAIGLEMPPESENEGKQISVEVKPHELALVHNEDMPDVSDAEMSLLEGEKQLELVINAGLDTFRDLDDRRASVEPKFLSRHIETSSLILGHTLDAIKHKTELQLKKIENRMKQKEFGGKSQSGVGKQNNFFVGSREDLLDLMQKEVRDVESSEED